MAVDAAEAARAEAAVLELVKEAWILLAFGILITGLRTYARVRAVGWAGLQWDDFLAWGGSASHAVETSLIHYYCTTAKTMALANDSMTDEYRMNLDPASREYWLRQLGSKLQIVGWSGYTALLWTLKLSVLVFYLRLTAGLNRGYRYRIYGGFVFLLIGFMVIIITIYASCRPFTNYWQIYPDPGAICHPAVSPNIVWTCFAFNAATDLYLLSIPLPMLWTSTLKPIKKVGLMVVFSGGLLVIMCATMRVYFIVTDKVNGGQMAGTWAVRESFIAIATSNLPMIFPLIKNWLTPVFGSLLTSMKSSHLFSRSKGQRAYANSGAQTPGGGGSAVKQSWRGRGPPTANPIPNTTFSESEERIVDKVRMQDLAREDIAGKNAPLNFSKNIVRKTEVVVTSASRDDATSSDDERTLPLQGNYAFAAVPRTQTHKPRGSR